MTGHACAVGACGTPVPAGMLMCAACWLRTPGAVKRATSCGWRNAEHDPAGWRIARAAAIRWHHDNPRRARRSPRTRRAVAALAVHLGAST